MTARTHRRIAVWFGLGLLVLLLVGTVVLPAQRAYGLVHPERSSPTRTPPDVGIQDYTEVAFASSGGLTLRGWYVAPRNGAVVIFVHGLGGNRGQLLGEAGLLVGRGFGALLFDLRNHGESDGAVTTLGYREAEDVAAAVDFVLSQPGVDPTRLALFGHSMGAAAVLLAAPDLPAVRAVVSASTYTSVEANVADSFIVLTHLPAFPFAPLTVFYGELMAGQDLSAISPVDQIGRLSPRPVLILHGERDRVVLARNAQALYDAAGQPKELYIVPGGRHYGFMTSDPQEYPRRLLDFLEKYLRAP